MPVTGRRRLEADPAVPGEVQLGPGVHVADRHLQVLPTRSPGQEADGDPGRDADDPGHHRHRGGELLAVARAVPEQEVLQRLVAAARQRLGAVGEPAAPQVGLDRRGLRPAVSAPLVTFRGRRSISVSGRSAERGGDVGVRRGAGRRAGQAVGGRARCRRSAPCSTGRADRADRLRALTTTSEFGVVAQSPAASKLRGAYGSGRYCEPKSSTWMVVVPARAGSSLTPGICGSWLPAFSRICTLPQPAALKLGQRGHPQVDAAGLVGGIANTTGRRAGSGCVAGPGSGRSAAAVRPPAPLPNPKPGSDRVGSTSPSTTVSASAGTANSPPPARPRGPPSPNPSAESRDRPRVQRAVGFSPSGDQDRQVAQGDSAKLTARCRCPVRGRVQEQGGGRGDRPGRPVDAADEQIGHDHDQRRSS